MFSLRTNKNKAWLIEPDAFSSLARRVIEAKATLAGDFVKEMCEDMEEERALCIDPQAPGLAMLSVEGVLYYGATPEEECFWGLYDPQRILNALEVVRDNPSINALAVMIDSPGGYVTAIKETAEAIHALSATKPVLFYAPQLCASAAYWIASAGNALHAAPFADVGSIGVYATLIDDTEFWKQNGYAFTYVRDGKYKAMGSTGKPYTDDEIQLVTEGVQACSEAFKGAVSSMRPQVTAEQMQGQCFSASDPSASGLVDSTEFRTAADFISYAAKVAAAL